MQKTRVPQRSKRPAEAPVRSGVGVAALAIVAMAAGLAVLSLGGDDEAPAPRAIEVSREAREAVRTRATERAANRNALDVEPLPLPARSIPAASKPRKVEPRATTQQVVVEPQWNGRGMPSREWLRWQLGALVEQGNSNGSVSKGALDAAIDDALVAREAKLAMLAAKDPEALVAAQERFDAATRSLAANLGVEHVDLSAF